MRTKVLRPSLNAVVTHVTPDPDDPDVYGNPGESTTTTTVLVELQQVRRSEETSDANIQVGDWDLFAEPRGRDEDDEEVELVIAGADRVAVGDDSYEVIGPPWYVRNLRTGEIELIRATLRRTT